MANKTNCTKNGQEYFRLRRKVGKKLNNKGVWVDDFKDFYGQNKSEAEAKYTAFIDNQKKGIHSTSSCFGEMVDIFICEVFLKDAIYKESTKERYINAYNNNLKNSTLSGLPLSNIRSIDLQSMYNELECAPSTVRSINNFLRHFFHYMEREGVCKDITGNLALPKVEKKKGNAVIDGNVEVWSDEELRTILSGSVGHRLHLLFVLAINTGCRIGELLALRYDDIKESALNVNKQISIVPEFKNGIKSGQRLEVTPTKTKTSIRTIPLDPATLAEVEYHKAWHATEMMQNGYRTEYIFTTKSGRFYDKHSLRTSCNRLYKRLGITARSFHVYRHTFGTRLAKSGTPIQTVSALMGHSDINVTAKYYINVDSNDKIDAIRKISL